MSFIFCALCKDTDFWNRMLASLSGTEMCPPTVPFPNELLFVLKDDAATELPPTHALTIYSSDPTRLNEYAMGITTAVVCPVHHIVLAVNCNKIPPSPALRSLYMGSLVHRRLSRRFSPRSEALPSGTEGVPCSTKLSL